MSAIKPTAAHERNHSGSSGSTFSEHIVDIICFFICTIMDALRSEHLAFELEDTHLCAASLLQ